MNDKELCKKCIYYDDFCCRNNKAICVNNSEYTDAEMVINAIINRVEASIEAQKSREQWRDDVQPVKRGRWSECYTDSRLYSGICSVCGGAAIRSVKANPLGYCPNCGARMDGDTECQ